MLFLGHYTPTHAFDPRPQKVPKRLPTVQAPPHQKLCQKGHRVTGTVTYKTPSMTCSWSRRILGLRRRFHRYLTAPFIDPSSRNSHRLSLMYRLRSPLACRAPRPTRTRSVRASRRQRIEPISSSSTSSSRIHTAQTARGDTTTHHGETRSPPSPYPTHSSCTHSSACPPCTSFRRMMLPPTQRERGDSTPAL